MPNERKTTTPRDRAPERLLDQLRDAEQKYRAAREAASRRAEPARQARNNALNAASAAGVSRYRLAQLLGISRNTVVQIVLDPPPATVASPASLAGFEAAAVGAHSAYVRAQAQAERKLEPARVARNAAIVNAARSLSQREIARVIGLSYQRVGEIINGPRAGRARKGPRQRRLRRRTVGE